MASTEQILKAATDLGKLIADHEAVRKFESILQKLKADVDAQRLLNDYNRALTKISEKEAAGQPIEVGDKRQLEQTQGKIALHPTLRELQTAQMNYLDLMRRVDEAMSGPTGMAEPGSPAPIAPGGRA